MSCCWQDQQEFAPEVSDLSINHVASFYFCSHLEFCRVWYCSTTSWRRKARVMGQILLYIRTKHGPFNTHWYTWSFFWYENIKCWNRMCDGTILNFEMLAAELHISCVPSFPVHLNINWHFEYSLSTSSLFCYFLSYYQSISHFNCHSYN